MTKRIGSFGWILALALTTAGCRTCYTVQVVEHGLAVGATATVDVVRCAATDTFNQRDVVKITNAMWFYKPTACFEDAAGRDRLDRWLVDGGAAPRLDGNYRMSGLPGDREKSTLRFEKNKDCILIAASVPGGQNGSDEKNVILLNAERIKKEGMDWVVWVGQDGIRVEAK